MVQRVNEKPEKENLMRLSHLSRALDLVNFSSDFEANFFYFTTKGEEPLKWRWKEGGEWIVINAWLCSIQYTVHTVVCTYS